LRTLKLTIAYDGTNYIGWQIQHSPRPTIQGTLRAALRQVLQERVTVWGSGRTDTGVHALAQVAHTKTRSTIACHRLRYILGHILPPDIAVLRLEEAAPGFHAQFSVLRKRYRYTIVNGPVVSPFERRYVHQVRAPLDVRLMRRELAVLRGRHDVRAFQRTGRPVRDHRRTITQIRLTQRGDHLFLDIEADGFLYAMVRRIVGTLIDIGRGHRPPGTMAAILKSRSARLAGPTAPPHGLCLLSVHYPRRLRSARAGPAEQPPSRRLRSAAPAGARPAAPPQASSPRRTLPGRRLRAPGGPGPRHPPN